MSGKTFYLTGTDTDAGKTWATTECLKALSASGVKTVGMKPVASGCDSTAAGLRNDDAMKLIAAGNVQLPYGLVNPIALLEPTAPEIAARHDGVDISLTPILDAYQQVRTQADVVLVEGVGGWLAPLSEKLEQADLVRALDCPVILVVGLKLGCINHARLTERALQIDGLECAGWIAAQTDPNLLFAEEYFDALHHHLQTPFLGRVFAGKAAQLDGFMAFAGAMHDSPPRV